MRFLVADDHPLYREAAVAQIGRLYPNATIDEVSSLDEAFELIGATSATYELFLLDFHMPGVSFHAIRRLADAFPKTTIAVISGTADHNDVRRAIEAGAKGFVPKTATADHFASAIRILLSGGTSIPAEMLIAPAATDEAGKAPWVALLSPRELQVLKAVARGVSNKQIGRELNLAEVTVKLHLRAVFRKIGAHSRAEAAVLATKAGLD